jgi:predicted nucleic acid-binding protein
VAKTERDRGPEPQFAGGAIGRYVESSALIAARLEGDESARQAILGEGVRFTSALTLAEFARHVVRSRINGRLAEGDGHAAMAWLRAFQRTCQVVDIDEEVLARVKRPFPVEPIRTLDAIHLATIELRDENPSLVAVVTRDNRVADNARAMGYPVE